MFYILIYQRISTFSTIHMAWFLIYSNVIMTYLKLSADNEAEQKDREKHEA